MSLEARVQKGMPDDMPNRNCPIGDSQTGDLPPEIKTDSNPSYRLRFLGGSPRDKKLKERNPIVESVVKWYDYATRFGTEVYNRFF